MLRAGKRRSLVGRPRLILPQTVDNSQNHFDNCRLLCRRIKQYPKLVITRSHGVRTIDCESRSDKRVRYLGCCAACGANGQQKDARFARDFEFFHNAVRHNHVSAVELQAANENDSPSLSGEFATEHGPF